jgi:hypothetical protein
LEEGVPNGGESHVTLVNLAPSLHHFMTLPEVLNKSYHKVSNEEPLIDYNKNIMMTSEHYLAILEQKLVRKKATTKNKMFEKSSY